jgi:CheY-like chemotaxis protein
VLVVDDDKDTREALAEVLTSAGMLVDQAGDGGEALERMMSGEAPDVILLDMHMPGDRRRSAPRAAAQDAGRVQSARHPSHRGHFGAHDAVRDRSKAAAEAHRPRRARGGSEGCLRSLTQASDFRPQAQCN